MQTKNPDLWQFLVVNFNYFTDATVL